MKLEALYLTCITAFIMANTALAEEFEVGQKNKQFTKSELTIKVGDSVSFPNHDPFFHNVFSLSADKTFDLGSYPKGETKVIQFNKASTIDVECAIHPNMQMKITVEE